MAHHRCTVPENCNIVPGQRGRDDRGMYDQWSGRVAEVEKRQVKQVDNQEQLALPEIASDPEQNEAESQEVMLECNVSTTHRSLFMRRTRIKCDPTFPALVT